MCWIRVEERQIGVLKEVDSFLRSIIEIDGREDSLWRCGKRKVV
jgi:hypothetical protein